jgi:lipopolysaccharide export system permease protein
VFRPKTLDLYILREVFVPVMLSLIVITIGLVVTPGARAGQVLSLLYCLLPSVIEQTLPLAVLLGVLLGIGRMSGDQELIAARACGISLYRLALPVVVFAIGVCPFALLLTMRVSPGANSSMRSLIMELTRTSGTWAVSEKVFNRNFPGITLYFDRLEQPGARLMNVLVSDGRNPSSPSVIVAKDAVLIPRQDAPSLTLRLYDGWIFGTSAGDAQHPDQQHFVRFATYDVEIALDDIFNGPHRVNELSMADLHAAIEVDPHHNNVWAKTEIARRWMAGMGVIPFALLGMLLGLTRVRGGRYERMVFALAAFFIYYVMMRTGEAVAQSGGVNAFIAVGFPDALLTGAVIMLFRGNAADRDNPGEMLGAWVRQVIEARVNTAAS